MNKRKTIEIARNASFMTLLVFLPLFNAQAANVSDPANEYDSMYRYNALENKVSFANYNFKDSTVLFPELGNVPDDVANKLQDIAEKQNFSTEQIDNAISVLKDENGFKTFLVGNNLGVLKFQLVQIKSNASELNALVLINKDSANKMQIDTQIKSLKEEQAKVENLILEQENKFSLFGWFVNIL